MAMFTAAGALTAAGAAAISTAIGATTTGISFAQAGKQKDAQRKAERDANRKMNDARKKLEVNYMDSLSIPLEAYEREMEALNVQAATLTQAAVEGDQRGAGAVAGRIAQAGQEAVSQQRTAMAKDLYNLEAATAEEDARLRDIGVSLDLGEVEGAQLAAADASRARADAINQGITGIGNTLQSGMDAVPLYQKSAGQKALADKMASDPTFQANYAKKFDADGAQGLAGMTPADFRATLGEGGITRKDVRGFTYTPPPPPETPFNILETFERNKRLDQPLFRDARLNSNTLNTPDKRFFYDLNPFMLR